MTRLLVCAFFVGAGLFTAGGTDAAGHATLTCAECHINHTPGMAVSGPLWNTQQSTSELPTFTLYSSPTFDALNTDIGQPDGTTRMCLGCHDGTYATLSTGPGGLAFGPGDLGRSHPVSFTYDSNLAARVRQGRLHDPDTTPSGLGGTIAKDLLDANGKMQCTSCHDVHPSTAKGPKLLRYEWRPGSRSGERLCVTCHNM